MKVYVTTCQPAYEQIETCGVFSTPEKAQQRAQIDVDYDANEEEKETLQMVWKEHNRDGVRWWDGETEERHKGSPDARSYDHDYHVTEYEIDATNCAADCPQKL